MAVVDLDVASIIAATGWNGATVANLSVSDDVRATGGTAGEFIAAELDDAPGDFNALNTVTLKVEARTVGTILRTKQLTVELRDSADTVLETFTTGDIPGAEAVFSSSAFSRADSLAAVNGYRLRCTVTEGGGMPDSATVEIDRMWVEIDYAVAGAGENLVRIRDETVGSAEADKRLVTLRRVRAEGLGITEGKRSLLRLRRAVSHGLALAEAVVRQLGLSHAIEEAVAVTGPSLRLVGLNRMAPEPLVIGETSTGPLRLSRLAIELAGIGEATATVVEGAVGSVVRVVLEVVNAAETAARSRRLARIRADVEAITVAVVRIGGAVRTVPAMVRNSRRMRIAALRRLIVGTASRFKVPPAPR